MGEKLIERENIYVLFSTKVGSRMKEEQRTERNRLFPYPPFTGTDVGCTNIWLDNIFEGTNDVGIAYTIPPIKRDPDNSFYFTYHPYDSLSSLTLSVPAGNVGGSGLHRDWDDDTTFVWESVRPNTIQPLLQIIKDQLCEGK